MENPQPRSFLQWTELYDIQRFLDYLPNPYIQQNLAFSFQLEYQAAQYYPQFYRGIYLAGYRYNLHLRPRSLLLEAEPRPTLFRSKNAMEPFADILDKVLQGWIPSTSTSFSK